MNGFRVKKIEQQFNPLRIAHAGRAQACLQAAIMTLTDDQLRQLEEATIDCTLAQRVEDLSAKYSACITWTQAVAVFRETFPGPLLDYQMRILAAVVA